MNVTEIAFTGYAVTDMKRAQAFYEGVLGLKKSRDFGGDQWVEYDIGGGCLALVKGDKDWPPSPHGTAAALEVDDFPAAIDQIRTRGIPFIVEPTESPVCHMAVIGDPDGNRIVIHRRKPSNI